MRLADLTPLVAATGIIITIIFQIVEWRRNRFARGLETIAALDSRFESPEFREIRRRAASHLLGLHQDKAGREAAKAVLNFFETVGFLYEKEVVDATTVWHFFASWLLPYYVASNSLFIEARISDPNCYASIKNLYRAVCKIEESIHPNHDTLHVTTPDAVKEMLESEALLELRALPSTTPMPTT